MSFIVDTNVLMQYPKIIEDKKDLVITIRCIEELDHLKQNDNPETAYQARRASNVILLNKDNIIFNTDTQDKLSVDNEIVFLAKRYKYKVISNDLNVLIKCWCNKIPCQKYNQEKNYYSGITTLSVEFNELGSNSIVDKILETKQTDILLHENEFLIIKNEVTKEVFSILQMKDNQLEMVNTPRPIINEWTVLKKIMPRNPEQTCLFHLLFNNDIKILLGQGFFGTGKTNLLTNYSLQELEKGHINKIVWVPNNAFNNGSREIGTLPGGLFEKELPFLGSLIDIIGEEEALKLLRTSQLEIVPISIMRGRNFLNSIIIVNEAQNLTEEHIKLLIGRCAEGTRIFFDGDIKQTDNSMFKNKNGLQLLLHLADSKEFAKIFGVTTLTTIERSFTARASEYLDNIC